MPAYGRTTAASDIIKMKLEGSEKHAIILHTASKRINYAQTNQSQQSTSDRTFRHFPATTYSLQNPVEDWLDSSFAVSQPILPSFPTHRKPLQSIPLNSQKLGETQSLLRAKRGGGNRQ